MTAKRKGSPITTSTSKISDPDEEITLKKILNYEPELLDRWKQEISRETLSLIDTTGSLEVVTPEQIREPTILSVPSLSTRISSPMARMTSSSAEDRCVEICK
jgi:transposase-like protein